MLLLFILFISNDYCINFDSVNERMKSFGLEELKYLGNSVPLKTEYEANYEFSDKFIDFKYVRIYDTYNTYSLLLYVIT
jgi:hypothetical protein